MIRDAFYKQILERLAGRLDDDLFEVCAASLLRSDFPTLVPVRGGTDSGMDGVTASSGPFLVCTTGKEVIRNLTKNLDSYKRSGGKRRGVLIATSQELSQKKRANLEERARSLGFYLQHIYDREAMAERLYHEPRWCKDLLGLTGRPSALTVIPRTERPLLDHPLVGREDDLRWLRETSGDRLIVGQPGCGKTFLLRSLALEGWGLFLVDKDLGAIADAIRAQQPGVVIVDDAHFDLSLLPALRRLRAEVMAEFDIVATSWEGDKDQVAESLSLPAVKVRTLGLLTRDEIVEVTKHAGLGGPVELIREIVDQSEGRAGLAVTLSYLCLNGDAQGVYLGEALGRSLGATFRKLVGQEANDILGAFAIGGNYGMSPQAVADALGISLLQLRGSLIRLAAGGVLREDREGRLSVRPAALRYVLVRDTFFGGKCDLPAEALMVSAPEKSAMAETLVGAIGRGAKIPDIIDILETVGSALAWREYASLGKEESKFVLQKHPELLQTVGQVTLRLAPGKTLPLLFRAALGDEREIGNAVNHPLRWVEDWISEAFPGKGQAVRQRKVLAFAARQWLEGGGDERVALRAAFLALNPACRFGTTDPGSGMQFTLTSALLTNNELTQIREVWSEVRSLLTMATEPHWERLFSAITPWVYPNVGSIRDVPRETVRFMHSIAAEMVRDIAELSREHPGVQQWARRMAEKIHADVETVEYKDFEALFPDLYREDWQEEEKKQMRAVSSLAQEWATRPAAEIAARLAQLEREAYLVGKGWPRYTDALCRMIADIVADPNPWLRELLDSGIAGDTAEPFLRKVAVARSSGWEGVIEGCFDNPTYERLAIYMVLTLDGVPEGLVKRALVALQRNGDMAELLCLRDQVPEPTLRMMLRHESPAVSTPAAVGVWCSTPRGEIREGIREYWRAAILKAEGVEHWLPEILRNDKPLACDWLMGRVGGDSLFFSYHVMEEMKAAISVLDFDQRAAVLQQLRGDGFSDSELVSELAGDDLAMYAEILKHRNLAKYHLAPLNGHPVGRWADKAVLAFDAGYTPQEVVDASFDYGETWTGNTSDRWQRWAEEFEGLTQHEDPRVREAARIGAARARENRAEELAFERQEAVYGR